MCWFSVYKYYDVDVLITDWQTASMKAEYVQSFHGCQMINQLPGLH